MGQLYLIVDIGGSQSCVALAETQGNIVERRTCKHPVGVTGPWILNSVLERTRELLALHAADVIACGIAFGGPVKNGRPLQSMHVAGWEAIDLCGAIEEAFGLTCGIENDGLAGALGEYHFGAAIGTKDSVYLTVSTGIGGGIILNGKLHRGRGGFAGHLGHLKIGLESVICPCGKGGCFEAMCSGTAIARRAREAAVLDKSGAAVLISRTAGVERLSAKDLFDGAREGDPFADSLVQEIAEDFGRGLASIFHALDPDIVVLGGGVPQAGSVLFDRVIRETRLRVMDALTDAVNVVPAGLGKDSALFGALAIAKSV